jgi:hypothetical protein
MAWQAKLSFLYPANEPPTIYMPKVAKKSSPVGVAAARVLLLLLLFPPLALFVEDVDMLRRILGAVAAATR